jgi:phenylacetate-CoA ligase
MQYFLFRLTQGLRHSNSLAILREIESTPFSAHEAIKVDQFRRLSLLLAHAEARVPYYREMFQTLGIKSSDIRNFKDFAQLPILTKDIVRARQRDLISNNFALESLIKHDSSGSTGIPLTFYLDHRCEDASDAGTYRNLSQSGWKPGEMIAFFWGNGGLKPWYFEVKERIRRMYFFNAYHAGLEDMKQWLKKWQSIKPAVALGFASTIVRFAQYIEAAGVRVLPLRGVFTTGEKLYPQQREVISRVFHCQVHDLYGSSEVRNIAAECSKGHMHINADFVVLETEHTGVQQAEGFPLIVTSLYNYAMPFIRYRNEDCGLVEEGSCSCQNNFPLMKLNIGRITDNFILPGGKVVHGMFFSTTLYGSKGIANFQYHQTAIDAITLWIVPESGSDTQKNQAILTALGELKAFIPSEVKIEVREVEEIPSVGGKHRYTRSDVGVHRDRLTGNLQTC